MLEIESIRRLKINLSDYDYQKDIHNRLIMSHFSTFDLEVLEEIIYNHLTIPIQKLLRRLNASEEKLLKTLLKLQEVNLLKIEIDTIVVNKEMRKYYEFQFYKFDDDFRCDMEFLQGLLKKVPIHVLPIWYSIPRSSNSIFDSILEKFLKTPQIYQRYLLEIQDNEDIFTGIISEVFNSPTYMVKAKDLCEKFSLSKEKFEEYMLLLEFSFACFLSYVKEGDEWIEVVTPLFELKEYLNRLKSTKITTIVDEDRVEILRDNDFAFIEDLTKVLEFLKNNSIDHETHIEKVIQILSLNDKNEKHISYAKRVFTKLSLIRFVEEKQGKWYFSENATDWLLMTIENKALHYYRHPLNQMITYKGNPELCVEKHFREAEKSIKRVLDGEWVVFDEFINGVCVSVGENSCLKLICKGKHWSYQFPEYTQDEIDLISASVLENLFEAGVVSIGWYANKPAFRVTRFGKSLFEF